MGQLSLSMETSLDSAQRWPSRLLLSTVLLRLVLGASLLVLLSILASVAARTFYVDGTSMAPTLYTGQLLLVNRAGYWRLDLTPFGQIQPPNSGVSPGYLFGGPRRGDVVLFNSPITGHAMVKRLIGLPGDVVQIDHGRVLVNGSRLDEPYVKFNDDYSYPANGTARVPQNAYFVLGDNRPASSDSHEGWFVPAENLVGQAIWPLPQGWLPYWSMPQPDSSRPRGSGAPVG
jgi:signal peptidase I